ncbi:hypothetical protein [Streptomyces sp. UNOB3_S3]|uniref:hypothetical protein n=1 Tax=Streptomyces sp. UNOB3_S3 TaxID=2871682 RepID=UPI001E450F78|nr:hypothetical protein [Streptomyces sp. UNOB3_S3]
MSTDNLNVRGIWTKLMDEHDYSVSYASIRYHLKHQQDQGPCAGDETTQREANHPFEALPINTVAADRRSPID